MGRTPLVALVAALWLLGTGVSSAGGSWLTPVQDVYQPGEQATLVGGVGPGQLGWVEDGPFFAYLRIEPAAVAADPPARWPAVHASDLPLGQLVIEERAEHVYEWLRISISFTVPATLAPGVYEVVYCNDPCTTGIGDLVGGAITVGEPVPIPGGTSLELAPAAGAVRLAVDRPPLALAGAVGVALSFGIAAISSRRTRRRIRLTGRRP